MAMARKQDTMAPETAATYIKQAEDQIEGDFRYRIHGRRILNRAKTPTLEEMT
jgi:hypothetical protein